MTYVHAQCQQAPAPRRTIFTEAHPDTAIGLSTHLGGRGDFALDGEEAPAYSAGSPQPHLATHVWANLVESPAPQ